MSLQTKHLNTTFEFGAFRLDPNERLLSRNGQTVPLTPKAFDVLVALVSRAGRLVTKQDLLKDVWPGTFVEEANLSYTVSLIRKALEEGSGNRQYIDTVQGVGYRFTAPVRLLNDIGDKEFPEPALREGNGSSESVATSAGTPPARQQTKRAWGYAAGTAAALLAAASIVAYLMSPNDSLNESGGRIDLPIVLPPNVEEGKEPTISPDGRSLVMTAVVDGTRQLVLRRLESQALVPVLGTEGGWMPMWSADSRSIAFRQGRRLKRIETSGGPAVDVCEVGNLSGGDWNRDGVILFAGGREEVIYRTSTASAAPVAVTSLDAALGETAHHWPHFLPDGRRFFYTADGREGGLYVGALDSKERKRLLGDGRAAQYVDSGYLLFLRGRTLMAQRFDPRALEMRGDAFSIADNVGLGGPLFTGFSVSRDGNVVYRPDQPDPTQLVWFGRDGSRLAAVGPGGSYRQVALSPSGRQAAVTRRDPSTGNFNVYVLNVSTGVLSRQTSGSFDDDPVWAPDERVLLFGSIRKNSMRPFRKDLVTGKEEPLLNPEKADLFVEDWTFDGRIVLRSDEAWSVLPAAGAARPRPLTVKPPGGDQLGVSADGKWVAFEAKDSGRHPEVYVASFPDFTDKRQISVSGGIQPLWRRDGGELFYLTLQGVLMAVDIAKGPSAIAGGSRRLFDTPLHPSPGLFQYAVTADGQRFLIIEKKGETITILRNWHESRAGSR
jgi:DNA-binding winged helix-turn-helix (wHTH) protein/Tol biopolymer transport system component